VWARRRNESREFSTCGGGQVRYQQVFSVVALSRLSRRRSCDGTPVRIAKARRIEREKSMEVKICGRRDRLALARQGEGEQNQRGPSAICTS